MKWEDLRADEFGARADAPGVDPNLVFADATRFVQFVRIEDDPPKSIPVIVELKKAARGGSDDALAQLDRELDGSRGGRIPSAYSRTAGVRYCTAEFNAEYCAGVLSNPQRFGSMIERFEFQRPVIPQRPRPVKHVKLVEGSQPPSRPKAGKTLIGVIDSGCPFAHNHLRSRNRVGTRVLSIWDQDASPAFSSRQVGGTQPMDFGYGCEASRKQLDAIMKSCLREGVVDEEACYAVAEYSALSSRFAHGAAVLDLLAGPVTLGERTAETPDKPPGWRRAGDIAGQADIVFVQLPRDAVQDSSSAGLPRLLLDGLRYILSCAGTETERIVVNISDGSSRGTHDGDSIIERAMLELVREQERIKPSLHIVIAAGNNFDERRHAQFDSLRAGESASVTLRLRPASEAPSHLVMRLPRQAKGLTVRIVPPGYASSGGGVIGQGQAKAWPSAKKPACSVIYPRLNRDRATSVLVVFAPTESSLAASAAASAGDWSIQFVAQDAIAEPIHLYISRNQKNPGALPRGIQATFVDTDGRYDPCRFLEYSESDEGPPISAIRRLGTLNCLGTMHQNHRIWVVGGYTLRAGRRGPPSRPSLYSSAGPAAGGEPRVGPDASLPTDNSRAMPGVRAMGTRSGENVRVKGTSFAAPQLARVLVNFGGLPKERGDPDPARNGGGNLSPWFESAND